MTESEQQQATSATSQQQHMQAPHPPAGTSSSAHVYLSNLPVEAYEGTIKHAFEQQGIQVVSSHATHAVSLRLQPSSLLLLAAGSCGAAEEGLLQSASQLRPGDSAGCVGRRCRALLRPAGRQAAASRC